MMRSLYSGVAGLKTHQTKMDVIGNNIANVNTVAFKSSSVTFNEIMYQTTQGASGPNAATGTGGINAKQIGLGVAMASTMTNITQAGATQTTGGAFDIKINGDSFFIVSDGTSNMFTRAGSFYVDAAGNLAMTSTGYNVMGWQVDPETGEIKKDTVSALRIMSAGNMTSAPEATKKATVTGVLDANAKATATDAGYIMNLNFYDALGYSYTAKFKVNDTTTDGTYKVALTDILDANGKTVITGNHSIGELFGTADSNSTDSGTLLAGRKYTTEELSAGRKIIKLKDDGTQEVVETDNTSTSPKTIYRSVLKDSSDKEILNSEIFTDENGAFYTSVVADVSGTKTTYYIPLSNTSDSYEVATGVKVNVANAVNAAKTYIRNYFADNYSGIDPDIYIDGQSTMSDGSAYYDTIEMDSNKFTTVSPYRFKYDTNDSKYHLTGNGLDVAHDNLAAFENYFNNSTYFKSDLNATEINNLLKNFDDSTKSANATITNDQSDYFVANVKGTTYYTKMIFNTDDGKFESIGNADQITLALSNLGGNFENISIDFTQVTNYNNGGSSTMGMDRGDKDGTTDAGKKLGALTGVSVDTNGMIYGSYDNGNRVLLGQIAVAQFANASGLEKVGDNCYQTTLNSGEFDGIGVDITADGGSMTTGALEMSNVDLSNEFTDMITTQRGFQANSRIITTSDTLLEELINLKR